MSCPQIMIIEDEQALVNLYKLVLERQGYDVIAAYDGHQALMLLETHTPQLVFLDIRLPYVSGLQVLSYLRSHIRFRHTYIVVNTSQNSFEHSAAVSRFLVKPVRPNVIADIANEVLSTTNEVLSTTPVH